MPTAESDAEDDGADGADAPVRSGARAEPAEPPLKPHLQGLWVPEEVRSRNELPLDQQPGLPRDIELAEDEALVPIGEVKSVMGVLVIVASARGSAILDVGSALVLPPGVAAGGAAGVVHAGEPGSTDASRLDDAARAPAAEGAPAAAARSDANGGSGSTAAPAAQGVHGGAAPAAAPAGGAAPARGPTLLGRVSEVFGPVGQPLYVVRFSSPEELHALGLRARAPVCYAPEHAIVLVPEVLAALRTAKGTDASNLVRARARLLVAVGPRALP